MKQTQEKAQNAKEVRRETTKVGLTGSEEVCLKEPGNTYSLLVQTLEDENVETMEDIFISDTPDNPLWR